MTRPRSAGFLAVVAVVLVALTLRGPFAAIGPVLGELRAELGVPLPALAVLASLPLVVLGLASPLAPRLAARLGLHRAVVAGVALLALGTALRLAGVPGLFAGTALLAVGIAVANVLLPALVRAEHGARAGGVVGLMTAAVATSAALGTGLAQPLAGVAGSASGGLALWLLPVLVAGVAMALLARSRPAAPAPAHPAPAREEGRSAGGRPGMLRDRVAVAVTLFFGLQSLSFYAMLTWLPAVLRDEVGLGAVEAGSLTALAAALGGPACLVVPSLAARGRTQVGWVVAVTALTGAGILGLLLAPAAAPTAWALLYGLGTVAAFPLSMALVLLRTRDVDQTGRLSAAAQSVGYLLAATGPLAVGVLSDLTGGWTAPLLLLLAVLAAQTAAGVAAGRDRLVSTAR